METKKKHSTVMIIQNIYIYWKEKKEKTII